MRPHVYHVTFDARVPLEPEAVFEGLARFEDILEAAPAVTEVVREGDGAVGTRYEIGLHRFGQTTTLETTVTATDPPRSLSWTARRKITGGWRVRPAPGGSRITIEIRLDPFLVSTIPVAGALAGLAAEPILARALRREVEAALAELVVDAGGDANRIHLRGPRVDRR